MVPGYGTAMTLVVCLTRLTNLLDLSVFMMRSTTSILISQYSSLSHSQIGTARGLMCV